MDEHSLWYIANYLKGYFGAPVEFARLTFNSGDCQGSPGFTFGEQIGSLLFNTVNENFKNSARQALEEFKSRRNNNIDKCVQKCVNYLILTNSIARCSGLLADESGATSFDYVFECWSNRNPHSSHDKLRVHIEKGFLIADRLKNDITMGEFQRFVRLDYDEALNFLRKEAYIRL